MKLDHGEYRSCFARMADDADFQSMSGDAFKLLWTLKLTLPVTGIGVVYTSLLAEKTGFDVAKVEALLAALTEPKPYNDLGWIVRDRNIVWVVKALACEPNLTPDNGKKHRPYVQRLVRALPESSPAVRTFKRFYAEWFPDETIVGTVTDTDSRGSSEKSDRVSGTVSPTVSGTDGDSSAIQKQLKGIKNTIKGEAVDLEHPTAAGAVDASAVGSSSATASPAAQGASNSNDVGTPPADDAGLGSLWQLLRECYDLTGKPTAESKPRQKQVYRDLRATLSPEGAPLEGKVRVHAVDAAHLNAACARVLARGVEKPDAAVRLVLLDLQKTWQETKAAREKASIGEDPAPPRTTSQKPAGPTSIRTLIPAPKAKGLEDAERWLAALGDEERARVTGELDREVNIACPANVNAPSTRAQLRADLLVKTWQHRDEQAGAA